MTTETQQSADGGGVAAASETLTVTDNRTGVTSDFENAALAEFGGTTG